MNVVWTPEAVLDRLAVWEFIAAENPSAAVRMDGLFSGAAAHLESQPYLGSEGAVPGTRELVPHASYRVVYEVDGQTVWILALVHTARLWPPLQEG